MNASLGLLCLFLLSVVNGRPTVFQGKIPEKGQITIQVDGDSGQVLHHLNHEKDDLEKSAIGRSFAYSGDGGGFFSTILGSIGLGSYTGNYDSYGNYGSYGGYDDDAYGGAYGSDYGSYGSGYDQGSYGSYGSSVYDSGYYNPGYGYGRSAHPLRNVY